MSVAAPTGPVVASHFDTLPQQAHAARLGMWIFLASEVLLFTGLFAIYAAYRSLFPEGFEEGVAHNPRVLGSINTGVLLCSSFTAATALRLLREGRRRGCLLAIAVTVLFGAAFLVIKGAEYGEHFREGIFPGGVGPFFAGHPGAGLVQFYTLYFAMTGLHALHVAVGMSVLVFFGIQVAQGRVVAPAVFPLENAAIYWHLVDVFWIFLWPLFYLTPGSVR